MNKLLNLGLIMAAAMPAAYAEDYLTKYNDGGYYLQGYGGRMGHDFSFFARRGLPAMYAMGPLVTNRRVYLPDTTPAKPTQTSKESLYLYKIGPSGNFARRGYVPITPDVK